MKSTTAFRKLMLFAVFILLLIGCEKPAGPGGRSSVKGKVYAKDFDKYTTVVLAEYYASGENVYICYGDDKAVGNSVKTSADGSFEFLYLNKGHYKIFVNSLDTSIHYSGADKEIPVIKEFEITDTRQELELGDIVINQ